MIGKNVCKEILQYMLTLQPKWLFSGNLIQGKNIELKFYVQRCSLQYYLRIVKIRNRLND